MNFPTASLGKVTKANFILKIRATLIDPIYYYDASAGDFVQYLVSITTNSPLFNITVSTNEAPLFEVELASQQVAAGGKLIYTLPKIVEKDGYKAYIQSYSSVPKVSFMKLNRVYKEN